MIQYRPLSPHYGHDTYNNPLVDSNQSLHTCCEKASDCCSNKVCWRMKSRLRFAVVFGLINKKDRAGQGGIYEQGFALLVWLSASFYWHDLDWDSCLVWENVPSPGLIIIVTQI